MRIYIFLLILSTDYPKLLVCLFFFYYYKFKDDIMHISFQISNSIIHLI